MYTTLFVIALLFNREAWPAALVRLRSFFWMGVGSFLVHRVRD